VRTRLCVWTLTTTVVLGLDASLTLADQALQGRLMPVQMPYEMPPPFQDAPPAVTVPPNTKPLTP
jgi:hypothetical protein